MNTDITFIDNLCGANSVDDLIENFQAEGTVTEGTVILETTDCTQNEMKALICDRFGFEEIIYNRVVANDFDIESLLVATDSEINDLFPAPLLGTRAKFKFHLNEWRKEASTLSITTSCRNWIELNSPSTSRSCSPGYSSPVLSPSSSYRGGSDNTNHLNLVELLKKSEIGAEVLKFYEQENCLGESQRDILTSVIVDNYSNNKNVMRMNDIVNATNAILAIFPSEHANYYLNKRGNGLNPTGKLHDKAVNARVKLRNLKKRQSEVPIQQDTTRASLFESSESEPIIINSSDEEIIIWLTHNNEPWADVKKKWIQVLPIRQQQIKVDSDNILKNWPLFKHSLGHTLVDIDYNIVFKENSSNLFKLWPTFIKKIVPYFSQHIKDKNSLKLLKKLEKDINNNSRDCILFLLLHAVLKPPIIAVGKKGTKRTKWKPTIIDSQESCILHCISVSHYMTKIDELKNKYFQKGLTFQPVIIAIGEEKVTLENFFTYYDGILYKFDSFLKCLDITFKLFHVMNFEYPKEGKEIYNMVENFFYTFNSTTNSNVTSILDYLKN